MKRKSGTNMNIPSNPNPLSEIRFINTPFVFLTLQTALCIFAYDALSCMDNTPQFRVM